MMRRGTYRKTRRSNNAAAAVTTIKRQNVVAWALEERHLMPKIVQSGKKYKRAKEKHNINLKLNGRNVDHE